MKVHRLTDICPSGYGLYYLSDKNSKKLTAIIKHYNIKVNPMHYYEGGRLIFWIEELEDIEDQYKLAKKKEQQK